MEDMGMDELVVGPGSTGGPLVRVLGPDGILMDMLPTDPATATGLVLTTGEFETPPPTPPPPTIPATANYNITADAQAYYYTSGGVPIATNYYSSLIGTVEMHSLSSPFFSFNGSNAREVRLLIPGIIHFSTNSDFYNWTSGIDVAYVELNESTSQLQITVDVNQAANVPGNFFSVVLFGTTFQVRSGSMYIDFTNNGEFISGHYNFLENSSPTLFTDGVSGNFSGFRTS